MKMNLLPVATHEFTQGGKWEWNEVVPYQGSGKYAIVTL